MGDDTFFVTSLMPNLNTALNTSSTIHRYNMPKCQERQNERSDEKSQLTSRKAEDATRTATRSNPNPNPNHPNSPNNHPNPPLITQVFASSLKVRVSRSYTKGFCGWDPPYLPPCPPSSPSPSPSPRRIHTHNPELLAFITGAHTPVPVLRAL